MLNQLRSKMSIETSETLQSMLDWAQVEENVCQLLITKRYVTLVVAVMTKV